MKYNNYILVSGLITFFLFIASAGLVNAGSGPIEGCTVTINKSASPSDNTEFTFQSNFIGQFVLQDPSNNSASYPIPVGPIEEVVEVVPEGWELVDVECEAIGVDGDNVENGVEFACLTIGGSIECTFFNEGPEPVAQVPTLSELGIVTIAALMMAAGIFFVYRKRKAAV